jgi:hypothetical protein
MVVKGKRQRHVSKTLTISSGSLESSHSRWLLSFSLPGILAITIRAEASFASAGLDG